MSLEEKPHKGGRKFKFMSRRKTYSEDFRKDSGDLVQMAIVVAALVVAAIVVTSGIAGVATNKGKTVSSCVNDFSTFNQGKDNASDCRESEENNAINSSSHISQVFGTTTSYRGTLEQTAKIEKQKDDLDSISDVIQQFYNEHGRYPITRTETEKLGVNVEREPYSDLVYNLHYCPSSDGKTFIISSFVMGAKEEGRYITYISNKNSEPKTYYTEFAQGKRTDETGKDIGGGSTCYNKVPGSTADQAGISGIGGDVKPLGDNKFVVPLPGWSGITPTGKSGWVEKG